MIGFKLDETTNDIVSSGGKITLLSTVQEAVRQRLDIKFNTFRGEWFLDTTYGMPYLQNIVGKAPPKSTIDAIYISEINNDPEVIKIVYFDSLFDNSTRKYSTNFEVKVNDLQLRVPDTVVDTDGVNYGSGDIPALQPSCEIQYNIAYTQVYPFYLGEDTIDLAHNFSGGSMVAIIKSHDMSTENIDLIPVFGGGALEATIKTYNFTPEVITIGAVFGGGKFPSVVYDNWADESVNLAHIFSGGLVPSINTNILPEITNLTHTFGGGTLS